MVLLEYLQKSALCTDNPPTPSLLDAPLKRQSSLPSLSTWTLLGPAARVLKGVNNTVLSLRDGLSEDERQAQAHLEERKQILTLRLKNATSTDTWRSAAKELDILEDNEGWKFDTNSSEFDAPLIEARLRQLDEARLNCDVKQMLLLVRTALIRDLGGMGNTRLYKHTRFGTKDLIERYIDSTLDTIRSLVETSRYALPEGLETKDILEQVVYARQAFGRSALLLSGGGTFGMNHVGVLKALFEAKLLPRIVSGASAGSIVCSVLCTRTDEEIPEVLTRFPYGDLAVFEEEGREDGILERLRRLLTQGAWIDNSHLTRVMQELLGDMTFQEAYNRTRRILNICVSSASVYELPRLLNYVTSPNVMIWSAVAASCSVPLLFSTASLLVKNPITGENIPWNPTPQRWIDGSVDNDLPMTRLAEMFNVNHFIVSQVNPHVVPFLVKDEEAIAKDAQTDSGPGWVYTLTNLAKYEALHRMQVLAEMGVFPNLVTKARSVLSQKYSGDITILPQIDYKDFPLILKNPTPDFMHQAILSGERATWPKLSRIRNHCAVELELDVAVQTLRARVVFSPSQVDLRRMTTGTIQTRPKRVGRRRDSATEVKQAHQESDDEDEVVYKGRKSLSRPPLRKSSSPWGVTRGLPPPMASPTQGPKSTHATPLLTPKPTNRPFQFPRTALFLGPQIPDVSSAGETTLSQPSSDADVDSHTDESIPDAEAEMEMVQATDFFSSAQPVTSGTDRVAATSPRETRANVAVARTRGRGGSATAPSSPERRYKRLFYGEGSEDMPK